MVLENIFPEKEVENKPLKMGILGALMSSIGIALSGIFPNSRGLFLVFLITMGMLPVMVKIMYRQEKEDIKLKGNIWQKHEHFLKSYLVFFFAVTLTLAFWYTVLPSDFTQELFAEQINEIDSIGTGQFLGTAVNTSTDIILNNLYVMGIAFLLSFIFASGAILIITWNASILGVAVGQLASKSFGVAAIPLTLSGFLLHGIPEVLAYLVAGLAGGILSRSVEVREIKSDNFKTILIDSTILFMLAIILVIIAGLIEGVIIAY